MQSIRRPGQILYPCVTPTPPTRIKSQLAAQPGTDLKLYWRIVTRGLHPDLVAANALDAFRVLAASALPRDRWEVEVVTDNPMDVPGTCPGVGFGPGAGAGAGGVNWMQSWTCRVDGAAGGVCQSRLSAPSVSGAPVTSAGRTKCGVIEIVVPTEYTCPNGGKFKVCASPRAHVAHGCRQE